MYQKKDTEIETGFVTHYALTVQLLIYNCHILAGFLVCLRCPDIKPLVMFLDWLDWWWRHMALIRRSFNLSVTMPRASRLIEFAEGLSWYKMFIMQSSNYFSPSCQFW